MKISNWRKSELTDKLLKNPENKLEIVYMWIKQGYITKNEFVYLINWIVVEDNYNL